MMPSYMCTKVTRQRRATGVVPMVSCGYEDNIGNRVSRYICDIGAAVDQPELEMWNLEFHKPTLEATHFNGW